MHIASRKVFQYVVLGRGFFFCKAKVVVAVVSAFLGAYAGNFALVFA